MGSDLRTSEAGLKLIMAYEGFRSHSKQLPDGRWVIGYGHMRAARAGLRVSQVEAAAILREFDLPPVEQALHELVLVPLNQNEFDALVSFTFNIGTDQFEKSDVLACLNAGDRMAAARAIERWRNARVGPRNMIVDPLVRRRADEKALFLKTIGPVPLAASSRFRPLPDTEPELTPRTGRAFVVSEGGNIRPDSPESAGPADETAPEAAARTVKERLTRILGEHEQAGHESPSELEDHPRRQASPSGETSVEEIRAAISALVSGQDEDPAETGAASAVRDLQLEEIDLPQADSDDRSGLEPGRLRVTDPAAASQASLYIDDVSEVEIPPQDMSLHHGEDREGPVEIIAFGLVSLLGAALFAFGGALAFGWLGTDTPAPGTLFSYLPPVLILLGGLIFFIMAYYWVRALMSED